MGKTLELTDSNFDEVINSEKASISRFLGRMVRPL
jgi:hypothetical protein